MRKALVGTVAALAVVGSGVGIGVYADSGSGTAAKATNASAAFGSRLSNGFRFPSHGGTHAQPLTLHSMPRGNVSFGYDAQGDLQAHLTMYGLTPGSTHEVDLKGLNPGRIGLPGEVTADATGQATGTVTFTGLSPSGLPADTRLLVRLATTSGALKDNALAAEPIAQTRVLSAKPQGQVSLSAVDVDTNGNNLGALKGRASVSYNSSAKTLTVTVNASGLTPGAHAAHIHQGSCQAQGPVLYMLMDLQADAQGNIVNQTRTITGVTKAPASSGWYLNIHQGDSNSILANGNPTLSFRPLLCANG